MYYYITCLLYLYRCIVVIRVITDTHRILIKVIVHGTWLFWLIRPALIYHKFVLFYCVWGQTINKLFSLIMMMMMMMLYIIFDCMIGVILLLSLHAMHPILKYRLGHILRLHAEPPILRLNSNIILHLGGGGVKSVIQI